MKTRILAAALAALALSGCYGGRAFTRGQYDDPNAIEMLSDKFNENDLQLIAKKMVGSLVASPIMAQYGQQQTRPVVAVGKFKNSTSEHIDLKSLSDKITVELMKTARFAFVDKGARTEIAEEYEYQGSGYVNPNQAKGPGQQASVDFLLTGEISSIVQEVGADKSVYYKMTTKLNNVKTGTIDWLDDKELRKKFEKQGVSW
jgi:penicillin-binding protein activator